MAMTATQWFNSVRDLKLSGLKSSAILDALFTKPDTSVEWIYKGNDISLANLTNGIQRFRDLPGLEVLHAFKVSHQPMPSKAMRRRKLLMRGRQSPRRDLVPIEYLAKRKLSKHVKSSLSLRLHEGHAVLYARLSIHINEPKCKSRMVIQGEWQSLAIYSLSRSDLSVAEIAAAWYDQGYLVRNRVVKSKQFRVLRALQQAGI